MDFVNIDKTWVLASSLYDELSSCLFSVQEWEGYQPSEWNLVKKSFPKCPVITVWIEKLLWTENILKGFEGRRCFSLWQPWLHLTLHSAPLHSSCSHMFFEASGYCTVGFDLVFGLFEHCVNSQIFCKYSIELRLGLFFWSVQVEHTLGRSTLSGARQHLYQTAAHCAEQSHHAPSCLGFRYVSHLTDPSNINKLQCVLEASTL